MNKKLDTLKIIHIALCAGMLLAFIALGNLKTVASLKIPKVDATSVIYLLIPLAAIFIGNFLYKEQLKRVDKKLALEEKIPAYYPASIIRWAFIEGASFFILFLKSEFILIGLFLLIYLFFLRPSEERMKNDFEAI